MLHFLFCKISFLPADIQLQKTAIIFFLAVLFFQKSLFSLFYFLCIVIQKLVMGRKTLFLFPVLQNIILQKCKLIKWNLFQFCFHLFQIIFNLFPDTFCFFGFFFYLFLCVDLFFFLFLFLFFFCLLLLYSLQKLCFQLTLLLF